MINLQDFVEATLLQIITGVHSAQKECDVPGATINPGSVSPYGPTASVQSHYRDRQGQEVRPVEFDVAVTAAEGTATKGSGGINIGVVSFGAKGSADTSSETTSRIRFVVPIVLPYTGKGGAQ